MAEARLAMPGALGAYMRPHNDNCQ